MPIGLALSVLTTAASPPAGAAEPWVRRFQQPEVLSSLPIWSLAQDDRGFLWLGTVGRLYRWDGEVLERHAVESLVESPFDLAFSPDGVLHLRTRQSSSLLRLVAGEVEPVLGPGGAPMSRLDAFAFDGAGRLWVAGETGLWWREGDGTWREAADERVSGGLARRLRATGENEMLVAARREVYRVGPAGEVHKVASLPLDRNGIQDLLELPDGRLAILAWWGGLHVVDGAEVRHVVPMEARGIGLVLRGDTLWASFDRFLTALRPGGGVEIVGREAGFVSGGSLLLDREGSLWLGTFVGLVQLPEPDTRVWTEEDGLPADHTRFVTVEGDLIWVDTWSGTVTIAADGEGHRVRELPASIGRFVGAVCRARNGGVLVGAEGGMQRFREGRLETLLPGRLSVIGCTPDEGALWALTDRGLYRVREASVASSAVEGPYPLPGHVGEAVILRDGKGRLWLGGESVICSAAELELGAAAMEAWDCEALPEAGFVSDLEEHADGILWAATRFAGVLERRGSSWVRLGGEDESFLPEVTGISPSPRGGVWLAGRTRVTRVVRDPGAPGGYRVVERLFGWHGLPTAGGQEVAEDSRGNVWITSSSGLVQVPPEVRDRRPPAPRVELVEALVDDERLHAVAGLTLPFHRNRPELRFAALSFRDPGLVRYQVRLAKSAPWRDAGASGRFRWLDLPPGSYDAAVRASLDGESWSAGPATLSFRVLPPWHRTLWARALFALLLVGVLTVAYRLRVAHLVALERQRSRIATDLHDEMGSGLGSIGVLAEILTRGQGDTEEGLLAREIVGTAHELGSSLSDIVWALDSRAATMEEVFARLAERGRSLLAGDGADLRVLPPGSWQNGRVVAAVRRNVLLIGLEALNNAARHSEACRVELELAAEGGLWRLTIRDDGRGMPDGPELRANHGLPGMTRRASEIGGRISWLPTTGGGATMELLFHPRGRRIP